MLGSVILYIRGFFTKGHPRTLLAKKNIAVSFLSKGIAMLVNFLIVPLSLSYIGKVEYGVWLVISSIIYWFSFFDIGLGNGLRNKLAEALALNDLKKARIYITSTFALITGIAITLFIAFTVAAQFISWNKVLNIDTIPNEYLLKIVIGVFAFFCLGFVSSTMNNILQAKQQYATTYIINIATQLISLAVMYILVKTTKGSLMTLSFIYAAKTPVIMLIVGIFLFSGSLNYIRPKLIYLQLKEAFPLIKLGFGFFLNQILYMILTQSSAFLVIQFFGPEEVTVYQLALKYMTIGSMLYLIVLTPFLTAFTEAYTKNDFAWINSIMNRINYFWLLTSAFTILLVILNKVFFKFWVGDQVIPDFSLILVMGINAIVQTFFNKYTLFLNGIGIIKLQFYVLALQALFFIPLSYLLYRFNFGLSSFIISQVFLSVLAGGIMFSQYRRIMNRSAIGIWNR
ncbi:MAG TPA: oligosaccharide flippase family protein [Bacteroidales bacterium]|nr:oligosaccharide flippase family protein [Bacteroidales bacterium]